jgi:hypothetical protein
MKRSFLLALLVFLLSGLSAQTGPSAPSAKNYELTVYVIPPSVKYDWSSPHTLYHSFIRNYTRNMLNKHRYVLGHAFVELDAPASGDSILTGMRSVSRDEQKQKVFDERYGLAILGTDLEGRLDPPEDLTDKMERYAKNGDMAFIRFLISEQAYQRMVAFYEGYKARLDSLGDTCQCYSGAFWPRYYGEGSGCSAFVLSMMQLGGLLPEYFSQWRVEINIPKDLMGGPYNEGLEVRFKDINHRMQWGMEPEKPGVDYEPFWIYDPTLIYDWVLKEYEQPSQVENMTVTPVTIGKAKGIEMDARNVTVPDDDIFKHRSEQSIFIDNYYNDIVPVVK